VQVDADRIHPWASFDPDSSCARRHSASGTGALGGPLLHDIKLGWTGGPLLATVPMARATTS
jgi:hypothetical protein